MSYSKVHDYVGLSIDYATNRLWWISMDQPVIYSADLYGKYILSYNLKAHGVQQLSSITAYNGQVYLHYTVSGGAKLALFNVSKESMHTLRSGLAHLGVLKVYQRSRLKGEAI